MEFISNETTVIFFLVFMQYLVIGVVNNCFNPNLEPWNEVIKIVRNAKIDYKQYTHISNNRQEEYNVSHLSLLNSCPFTQSFIYNVFSLNIFIFPMGKALTKKPPLTGRISEVHLKAVEKKLRSNYILYLWHSVNFPNISFNIQLNYWQKLIESSIVVTRILVDRFTL